MSNYLQHVLRSKMPAATEIELHLFEFCNLSCAFCGQDHDSDVGMNVTSLADKADQVIGFMKSSGMKDHNVNVMGGEIFNDEVPDVIIFDGYTLFHRKINDWCTENGHNVRFNWVTNLIFSRGDRILAFIRSVENSMISTSYDFAGRGLNINRAMQFEHNLNKFSLWIGVVGFVLTKPSIRKILTRTDSFFDNVLYPNHTLYFDYYVPELSSDKMMPSEQEMLDCMLYVAEHYPNVYPIKDLLENGHNTMTCYSMNKTTILPTGREVKCRYMDYETTDFVNEIDYTSNNNIIQSHLDRHGCLSCQWFDRCALRCFVQADWAKLNRLEDCMFRMFFNEAERRGLLQHGFDY